MLWNTVHPQLSEQLKMNFWNSCLDRLNNCVIENASISEIIKDKE